MESTTFTAKFADLQIPLEVVLQATNNFADENVLGLGEFGPAYKGRLLRSGKVIKIAAKRLDRKIRGGDVQFWTEVSLLFDLNHENVVSLIGFCDEKGEKIIITPSMANGSLEGDLENPDLTWTQRLRISVGVARALSYLHYDKGRNYGVIHRNVNSSTILLDENLDAKLSGFGISIRQPVNRKDKVILTEPPIGTMGYMDPLVEKARGVTRKSDIYSLGVVLIEMLCGRSAYVKNEEDAANRFLAPLVKYHYENKKLQDIIHTNLLNEMSPGSLVKYSALAYSCLQEEAVHRLDADDIVKELEEALKLQLRYKNLVDNFKHLKVSFNAIKSISDNFIDTWRITSDGVCSCYRVKLPIGDIVIKRYHSRYHSFYNEEFYNLYNEESFFNEIQKLTSVKHPNIVTLLAFCVEGFEMILITRSVSHGYLGSYLENDARYTLTWDRRLRICIDIAQALNYLHFEMEGQKMIIHNCIHSYGISLDENMRGEIGDFWFSVFMPPIKKDEDEASKVRATDKWCYVDPELLKTRRLEKGEKKESKRESDVYSFGVVLLEILCGRLAYDEIYTKATQEELSCYDISNLKESHLGLAPLAKRSFTMGTLKDMIDPIIKEQSDKDSLHTFIKIAIQCVTKTQDGRPTMKVVLGELQKSHTFQEGGINLTEEDGIQRRDRYRPVDELEQANHEILEEEVQHPIAFELGKALELQLRHEFIVTNFEHLKVPLVDIKSATRNFSSPLFFYDLTCRWYRVELDHLDIENHSSVERKNKGKHPKRHSTVVMKRYPSGHHLYNEETFFVEIEMLTSVKHPNIATLLGFCFEDSEMILVFENVSNGFFSSYLGEVKGLDHLFTWENRLKICIDIARALNYLHSEMEDQKMIINRLINSNNIGLDENWEAKIVDFVASVYLPPDQEDEALYLDQVGTLFHIDPEYQKTRKLKRESDVYSFGVVLFEILSGKFADDPIYRENGDKGLAHVARQSFFAGKIENMIDPIINEEAGGNNFVLNKGPNKDSLEMFIGIALCCVVETQDRRPTMKTVLGQLEKALLFQKINTENPRISLEDINKATQNFHNDNCIGEGGFGDVYKGTLQVGDGFKTIVAKRLDRKYGQGAKQFLSELQILIEYKHENIIGFVGYCDEKDEKIIVYEYAPRGSLDRYLNDASLTWVTRLNICIDVASALDFLHGGVGQAKVTFADIDGAKLNQQAKVIHRDLKSANILLNEDWKAKLGDFGLSLISPLIQDSDYVIDHACGTPGYLDPLYRKSGFLTIESDIYSFGVVLFEILCGRSTFAIRKQEGHYLPDFIKNNFEEGKYNDVVFEQIREEIMPKSLIIFQEITFQCLHGEREKRPTTKKVLMQLKKALDFQNMASTITKLEHLRIPLADVVEATNNFHLDNIIPLADVVKATNNLSLPNFIEHDDFGKAYEGKLLRSGRLMRIAAQRFDGKHEEVDLAFFRCISVLSDLKHSNLVSIIGFCYEKGEKIIVTKYEANGCLESYLKSSNFIWSQRLRICVGIARGLSYLHYDEGRDYGIIHCNITRGTILLDENLEAKLSGFEISIKQLLCYKDQACHCEHIGKMGCTAPSIEEVGGVTFKSDLYAFGVVLFEMMCKQKDFLEIFADFTCLGPFFRHFYQEETLNALIHPDLSDQVSTESYQIYVSLALYCLFEKREGLTGITSILSELENALELQLRHENTTGKAFKHLDVSLDDIKSVTNNFSDTYKFDSYNGVCWYRVELDHFDKQNHSLNKGKNEGEQSKEHRTVIIKRYPSERKIYREEKLFIEIEMLSNVKHPNIVTILGFYVKGLEKIIIIENISNGYLGSYLQRVNDICILTWEKRLQICIDIAHALRYIHYEMEDEKVMINRCIDSYSIGLDEKWGAKIMDFSSSVYLPPNQEDEALYIEWAGKPSYIDPEHKLTCKLKRESDVYSFGVVLLEILCGRMAYDPIYKKGGDKGLAYAARKRFSLGTLEEMIDPIIKEETNKDSLHTFIEIAYRCVLETQDQRPTMKFVVKELEKALFLH